MTVRWTVEKAHTDTPLWIAWDPHRWDTNTPHASRAFTTHTAAINYANQKARTP